MIYSGGAGARAANAIKAATPITLTCARCGNEFDTTMLRASAKFCGDECRGAHDADARRRWKVENRDRHLANRRAAESRPGKTRDSHRRRNAERAERLKAARPPRLCRDCRCEVGPCVVRCDGCRRTHESELARRQYQDDIERSRAEARDQSLRRYRADPIAGATSKARRKWRRMYGEIVDRPEIARLLEQRLIMHRALGMYQARRGGRQRFSAKV